ncbi:hypothetical protein YPPY72_3456 [Yersinia pestis PY-72]|uniref:Uncharacterized protein n=2 Tax=Yersinia pestis TaxID=632 RepID=Q8CLF1_YERPE|nr:hypothetical [Yersinia pestis KIM10+]EIR15714.1 hypothetical protein YPPY08_3434 [Yersinia pestis PY-08]EIR30739.1 hypothetical protein YPPY11_3528 [Yersinia pestis PY-11]EIS16501.1 hypothetical protein YPPY53_3470 [Yersinia pestis PY-53]EIS29854.1 hypothetical protein YPPY56_3472 [Yersinia pestis PY-56]EIS74945.1 hypothetical protein YPPY71_3210 [Yersinia pestis PY-71]EIS76813.1 hypothetical protein YPPY72_3456 [Yersinia pestis PY-72]EIS92977.1 hypothetical protein YPPY89_3643 [Yersinia 
MPSTEHGYEKSLLFTPNSSALVNFIDDHLDLFGHVAQRYGAR